MPIGNAGGAINTGDIGAQFVSQRIAAPQANMAAMKGLTARETVLGMRCVVNADGSHWRYHDTSVLTGDDILVSTPSDGRSAGRWLRDTEDNKLVLPFTFATVDATALLTLQAGQQIKCWDFYWSIGASMTGGASSAIGVSANVAPWSTKGDLLGGATGDLAAALVAGPTPSTMINGTAGAKWDTVAHQRGGLVPTNFLRFDRIASAFTAGSGAVVVLCDIVQNDGA